MNITEFVAAGFIAVYAMIGGAFINAAITAPENCLRVLSWIDRKHGSWLWWGGAGTMVGAFLSSDPGRFGVAMAGAAHIALAVLFAFARSVAHQAGRQP